MVLMMRFMRCELRKGCTFIGVLWLVFSVLITMGGLLTIRMFEEIKDEEYRNFNRTLAPELVQFMVISLAVFRTCFYGVTTIAVADAILSTMLIIGAQMEKRALVLPWALAQLGLMPGWVLVVLAFAALCFVTNSLLVGCIVLLVVALRIGVTLYSIQMVYGLYEYLRRHQAPANYIRVV